MPRLTTLAIAAALAACLLAAQAAQAVMPWGTPIGACQTSPDAPQVAAFSNGNWEWHPDRLSGHGKKWQCVEYVNRFYAEVYGLDIEGGDAKHYFERAALKGLVAIPNGAEAPPQPGDILCSEGPPYGHVAIVRALTPEGVRIVQQNWYNDERDADMLLPLKVEGGRYWVGGFGPKHPIQGWLRPPQTAGPGDQRVVPVGAPAPAAPPASTASATSS